jgi:transcriptional activator of comK gene
LYQKKQTKVIIRTGILVCLCILLFLAYKTNSILTNQRVLETSLGDPTRVGIITSDVVNDQSWGGLAYEGKLRISELFPIEVELLSEKDTPEEMKAATLELIEKSTKLIIGHGREFSELFTELAPNHENVHFVTIHGTSVHPNQSVFTYKDFIEGYYAAGMTAGLMSKSKKIAIIAPFDPDEETVKSFIKGIDDLNLNIEYMIRIVGSRDDEEKALLLTKELVDLGVDVIFSRGNLYNRVVIDEVRKSEIYAIGFIDDQSYMAKDHVLTSVMNDVPQTYVKILEQYFNSEGIQSGTTALSYKDGVYRLADFGQMVPPDIRQRVSEYMENFHRGELTH